ncbi:MAG: glycosyltransferase [Planctomycetia bacterium]|nr:glycosyltransferase [Planctomycetia bacterium]
MITICQLLHSLNIGGAEVLAAALGRKMASENFRFLFFCLDEEGEMAQLLRREGFLVECLGRRPGFDRRCMQKLRHLWQKYDVSLVHAHQYTPFFYALAARGLRGKTPPILFTEHGRFYPDLPNWKHKIFNRFWLKPDDRIVAVGQAVKDALVENEGLPEERIEVIYNGINPENFKRTPERIAQGMRLRHEMGVPEGAKVFVHIARLDPIKDHLTAICTMNRFLFYATYGILVPEDNSEAVLTDSQLWFVGQGPQENFIREMIAKQGLEKNVKMLGLRKDIASVLAAADAFLLTSVSEGIPVTILEAMAASVPVVSTEVGGVNEIIMDGVHGRLAPSGKSEILAEILYRLVTQKNLALVLIQNAHERLQKMFTQEKMHEKYRQVFLRMGIQENLT